ncbi:insulinase family protein [Pseudothauera nasutitermitis]|uniref:Insulinase family protein n=1 Tax=Pseudothauera nasutitermitis TaxID=2565930 RepID=A0A4S4AUX6_9RHOO|nr:pitrilysin family protein [Pseudothauera nasutitermitis]THF63789.1 insulinase family protein [Pseudothauera nasutitermitis]
MYNRSTPLSRLLHALAASALLAAGAAQAGPQIQHWTADTGARVYFVESRALPMVDIQVDFAAGGIYAPPERAGVAGLTRSLLDAGTATLDEQAIAERSADIGAILGGSADEERASLSLRTLSSATEREAAVDLVAELLARPTFPEAVVEREKARAIAGLREALTQPGTLAARAFGPAIYGDHPYGRTSTEESLAAITRADLVDFHHRHYTARRASIAIVGDVSRAQAAAIAERLTAGLPAGEAPTPLAQPAQPAARTLRIAHPSAQAHILLGLPGLSREDPDYYSLLVGNYVLGGGGFVSRLTREVREKRGFAYSVYSHFAPMRVAGPFQIGLQTRADQIDAALGVVHETLNAFIQDGPTEAEIQGARDNLINGFGLRLDSNGKILGYVAMIGFYGLPLDWLDAYPGHIAQVSAAAVRDAFARRIRPEHLVTVVVGGGAREGAAP